MQTTNNKGLRKKRIAVSGKRQITIPIDFFNQLGIEEEVECYVQDGSLIIRRAAPETNGEFAEQILADLIAQGLHGEELRKRLSTGTVCSQIKRRNKHEPHLRHDHLLEYL